MKPAAVMTLTAARRTQEWLRERPRFVDVLFAALMAVLALSELTSQTVQESREPDQIGVALILVGACSLAWRRVAPAKVFVFIIAVSFVFYARNYGSFMSPIGLAGIYAAAAHESNRSTAWMVLLGGWIGLFGVASFTVLQGVDGYDWSSGVSMSTSIGATMLAGAVIRNKEEIFADTQDRAERAEAGRQAEAERAVARERLRIAREMHDVVAHGMSLMTVQAAAAQEVVATRPEDAARLMHSVETTGRDALTEMRRMLGVLRNDEPTGRSGERGELVPQPSLGDIHTTIAHCIEAGTPTELTISGDVRALAPGVELAAFRTVQEALTNVVKHGGDGATATVVLRYESDVLHIEICDTGRGAATGLGRSTGGHGLIGMQERIEIYDGLLTTGPQPGGGYAVKASLPITARLNKPAVVQAEREIAT